MSLFVGKKGLRHQFTEVLYNNASLTTATSKNASMLAMVLTHTRYKLYIDNQLNKEIAIYVEHGEALKEADYAGGGGDTTPYRLLLTKVSAMQTLSYSIGESPQIQFDADTKIYFAILDGAPTSGKVKINAW
jgi:hypothetical protein